MILQGTVGVLVPNTFKVELSQTELIEYIKEHKDEIMWDDTNKHILGNDCDKFPLL